MSQPEIDNNKPKTWKEVWEVLSSPSYLWVLAGMIAIETALGAINKWFYHLPSFPNW